MAHQERRKQVYDHRLRELVRRTGDIRIATDVGVPRSTAAGWLRADRRGVVSLDVVDLCEVDLQAEVVKLRRRVATLTAVVGLLLAVRRAAGSRLERAHVFDRAMRAVVLRAAERARKVLPAKSVLRILGISASRYAAWTRVELGCALDEHAACPRSVPNQLTTDEVFTIREMVTDERYRHAPTGRLAILAQRLGKVFASPASWYRLVRDYDWRRPRNRLHPDSPSVGVRGSRPDEVWHIDTSILRLTDGTKVWLHAVIDNFSRKILAWRMAERFEISSAVAVLKEAVERAVSHEDRPQVMVDGGVENFNGEMDELVVSGLLGRMRALIDVRFSNSMIETWWRTIKHQWLFLHRLETAAAMRRHVAFYVREYNETIPHSAFRGQTPNEVYFGRGGDVPGQLEVARRAAQARRLEVNRKAWCGMCPAPNAVA